MRVIFSIGRWIMIMTAILGIMIMGAESTIWPWNILIGAAMFFPPVIIAILIDRYGWIVS